MDDVSERKQMDITGAYPFGNQTSNYIFRRSINYVLNHEGESDRCRL